MAGRFTLYTDADLYGPLVEGLRRAGWNRLRAIEAYPERTLDVVHFERAVREGRVMVSNDRDVLEIAERWFEEGRPFPGLIFWAQRKHHRLISIWLSRGVRRAGTEGRSFLSLSHRSPQAHELTRNVGRSPAFGPSRPPIAFQES